MPNSSSVFRLQFMGDMEYFMIDFKDLPEDAATGQMSKVKSAIAQTTQIADHPVLWPVDRIRNQLGSQYYPLRLLR